MLISWAALLAAATCLGQVADLGNVPEWIGALGTVGSLLAVGGGLWWEIRQRRLAAEFDEADQARLVTAISGTMQAREFSDSEALATITVYNHSREPVYEIVAGMLEPDKEGRHTVEMKGRLTFQQQSHMLAPGSELRGAFAISNRRDGYPEAITWLMFTDSTGKRWRRVNNGPPTKAK